MDALVPDLAPADADGQVQRVARHLSLIAAAGELAISYGVLPWPAGEAVVAVRVCFAAWLNNRGTAGASEIEDAVAHLRSVIERDGASRFQSANGDPVRDRLGFVREIEGGDTQYLVMREAWRALMIGRDAGRAARDLVARAIVIPGSDGRPTRKERVPGHKNPQRVYVISHAAIFDDGEAGTDG